MERKDLPEGRFVEISYDVSGHKVVSVTYPVDGNRKATTHFSYTTDADGSGTTEATNPTWAKSIYLFDQSSRLTGIEQYLNGDLYRTYRKYWGQGIDISQLIGFSLEDGSGTVLLHKSYTYDDEGKGNIIEEEDHGNLTGANPGPVRVTYDGIVYVSKESHSKRYSYESDKNADIINQLDAKRNGLELIYKKGTNFLLRKTILERGTRKKRWIYEYNDDGALTQLSVDDHDGEKLEDFSNATERHITKISPKSSIPNAGAPEVIEEKCLNIKSGKEILIGKTVNHFDEEGNVGSQDIYDAKGEYRYSIKKTYSKGLLTSVTDPLGNQVLYSNVQTGLCVSKRYL